jgi:hypothetical protein
MTTPVQLAIVALVVVAAAAYILRSVWRTLFGRGSSGCGASCGKCAPKAPEVQPEGRFPLPQA